MEVSEHAESGLGEPVRTTLSSGVLVDCRRAVRSGRNGCRDLGDVTSTSPVTHHDFPSNRKMSKGLWLSGLQLSARKAKSDKGNAGEIFQRDASSSQKPG